mgnify:CR=1 FL=1
MSYAAPAGVSLRTPLVSPLGLGGGDLREGDLFGAVLLEGGTMFSPKWAVIAVALAIFAMAASYDAQLGLAVGVVLVVITAIALAASREGLALGPQPARGAGRRG